MAREADELELFDSRGRLDSQGTEPLTKPAPGNA